MGFCGIHMRAILQEVLTNLMHKMCSEIALLNLFPNNIGVNELILGHYKDSSLLWLTGNIPIYSNACEATLKDKGQILNYLITTKYNAQPRICVNSSVKQSFLLWLAVIVAFEMESQI